MKLSFRAKNFIAVLTSNFGIQGLRFLTITVLARRLGNDFFGAYNYILLLVTYGTILTEFGLRNLGIREFSQNKGSRKLIKQILTIRLVHALAAVAAIAGLTSLAFPDKPFVLPALLIASSLFADALFLDFILVAKEALVPQATGNLAQAAILLAGCFFFVHSAEHFKLLGILYLLSHVAWALVYFLAARKFWPHAERSPSDGHTWRTALSGMPFMIALLASNFQNSMDLLLLGQFHYENLLGTYSAALKIIGMSQGLVIALVAAVQPRLARQSARMNSPEMKDLIWSTTRFLWLFVAPTVIGCWLFGEPLVKLVFGPGYESAAVFIKPLSLSFALLTLSMAPLTSLMVSSQTKAMLKIICTNCGISILVIGGLLVSKHPLWVPWGMVVTQAILMLTLWGWFGVGQLKTSLLTVEDFRSLCLPVILLILPLFLPTAAILRFCLAAFGYVAGLLLPKIWKRPWFIHILGAKNEG